VVSTGTGGVIAGRFEDRADSLGRIVQSTVGPSKDRGRACARRNQSEQNAERRRLAGAVGTEEPRDAATLDAEAEVVDGDGGAESFRQSVDLDDSQRSLLGAPMLRHRSARLDVWPAA
jgi:hypothetical protein